MTPLAAKVARDLTVPKKARRFDDRANVLDLFDQDMHCFEVTAIARSVNKVMDEPLASEDEDEAWSVWRDIESMLPRMFLPSPVTWLEQMIGKARIACVLREKGAHYSLETVHDSDRGPFSIHMCDFRARGVLEPGDRIEVIHGELAEINEIEPLKLDVSKFINMDPSKLTPDALRKARAARDLLDSRVSVLSRDAEIGNAGIEVMQAATRFIGMAVLTLDLINTPGLIGLKQREINKVLARRLLSVGRYPLRAWSEVVLKHQTRHAEPGERVTGATYHKCLHFVRSHLRHYKDGRVTLIPAHWRGDAALGIKRTRYRLAA